MSLTAFFALHPVFTREALVRHLTETGGKEPNPATVRELLRYHQRTGRILAVRRGLFATVPPGSTPESAPIEGYPSDCEPPVGVRKCAHQPCLVTPDLR